MSRLRGLSGGLAAVVLCGSLGCDTNSPPEPGPRNMQIAFQGTNAASTGQFDVYDVFEDGECHDSTQMNNPKVLPRTRCVDDSGCVNAGAGDNCVQDGMPDDLDSPPDGMGDSGTFCEAVSGSPSQSLAQVSWSFTVEIGVIRADTTQQVLLTGAAARNLDNNLTPYDTTAPLPVPNPRSPFMGLTQFTNPRRVTSANRDYLNGFVRGDMLLPAQSECLNLDLGEPRIAGGPATFGFQVNKGDTVIVGARKPQFGPGIPLTSQPTLAATMTLDGSTVIPNGTFVSSADDGAGISFSFTVR